MKRKNMTIVIVAPLWDLDVYVMNQITQIGPCISNICFEPQVTKD